MTEETASGLLALPWYLRPIAGGSEEDGSDENTPTPDPGEGGSPEGTPATESTEDSQTSDIDWQERYANLQPAYTQATQEAAALRQVIDLARQGDTEAREYLGWDTPADTEPDDGESTSDDRLAQLEQQFQEQEEQRRQAEQEAQLEEAAERFYSVEFERLDPDGKWDAGYRRLVAAVGDEFLDDEGLPDLEEANKAIQAQFEQNFKARVASKRAPQAPSGASPSHTPDLDDKTQRRDYLAQRAAELAQGEPV